MASTMAELNALHVLVTESFKTRITQDLEDNIPTDAATLGAAIKFLKDNAVSADPADADDLADLRKKLTLAAENRRKGVANIIGLAKADEDNIMVG